MRRIAAALFLATFASRSPLAAQPPAPAPPAQTAAVQPGAVTPRPSHEEVAVLRAQLETMIQFQDALTDTVYWSLSTLAALVVLLVGFNWLASFRLARREVEAIKEELRAQLATAGADHSRQIDERLGAVDESITGRLVEAQDRAVARAREFVGSVSSDVRALRDDLNLLELHVADLEVESLRGRSTNSLVRALRKYGEAGKKLGWEWPIDKALGDILAIVERQSLDADETSELTVFLNSLPDRHELVRHRIREALKERRAK